MDLGLWIFIAVMTAAAVAEIIVSMKLSRKSTVLLPLAEVGVTGDIEELILRLSEKTPVYIIDMGLSAETAKRLMGLRENIFVLKNEEILTYL